MKKIVPFIICLISGCVASLAQPTARVIEKEFTSDMVRYARNILIYTPAQYDEMTQTDYDVIYVFDSQWRERFDLVTSLMHYFAQGGIDDPRNYIVVGIASPQEEDYNRNNDFLPVPQSMELPSDYIYYGNSSEFKKFISGELMPWIDSNYRTTGRTLAVGHSLGASFIIDAMVSDEMFDDCIAMSPNFSWDNDRFADEFLNYDFSKNGDSRFICLTMADEVGDAANMWGEQWGNAWRKVKAFIDSLKFPAGVVVRVSEFPEYDHSQSVLPALTQTLAEYAKFRTSVTSLSGSEPVAVHIELSGSDMNGDIYITGNQEALANWNPEGIKMQTLDDSTKVIDLSLTLPAEFKFTRGSWDSQICVSNGEPGNLRITKADKADKRYLAL